MKKLLYRLRPPDIWERPVIKLLGIFASLALYGFYISKAWSYLGDEPQTCINCHVMIPEYANWQRYAMHNGIGTMLPPVMVPHFIPLLKLHVLLQTV
jgi:cytochrome c nitrite reductase small subunit